MDDWLNWDLNSLKDWRTLTIASAFVFVVQAMALYSALHAIRHVRTSQAAVAWVVGLLAMPIVTVPFYWVFAQHHFEDYRAVIRQVGQTHHASDQTIARELATEKNARTTPQSSPLEQLADILDTPLCDGNRFELLIDGECFFDSVLQEIRQARKYVYACFFILRDDEIGNRVADAWIERARAGVTVRVLYDEVGCVALPGRYLRRLRAGNVDVRPFDTRQKWSNPFQLNFRNHRKSVVVDGRVAFVGGENIGDEYVGETAGKRKWRDTALRVSGPLTCKIQAVFAHDYFWATRNNLPEANWGPPEAGEPHQVAEDADTDEDARAAGSPNASRGGRGMVCATGPADLRPRATMMYAAAAAAAQHRLWISTPYLVPDDGSMLALQMCRARGVDVRLLIPAKVDHWAVYLAGFYYEHQFDKVGIPVYRYHSGFLHQKCVLVDDSLVLLGSTNLDNRSLHLNFELMVGSDHPDLIAEVTAMLGKDFESATHSDRETRKGRWWFARLGTAVARLFSPIL